MSKKVYITSLHLQHGGVEMAITLLANALVKRGYEVEILCTYNLGAPVYKLDSRVNVLYLTDVHPNREDFIKAIQNGHICKVVKQGIYALKVLWLKKNSMARKIKEIKEGSIITTRNEHAVILSKYGNTGVKKIAQLHHDHQFNKKLMADFRKRYKNIDIFVLLTETLKQEVEEVMYDNKHTKHVVIPNFLSGVEMAKGEKRKNQVIAVGRMHEVKGFLRMLEVWKAVRANDRYVLKLVGGGEQFGEVEKKIKELELDERVILTGHLGHEEVMQEMRVSKVYLMTSYSEAFPFVLIEAMAAGLPIVAYDVRVGPRAIIKDKENGFLVPEGDKEAFVQVTEQILSDEQVWRDMSLSAQNRVKEFFEECVIKKWIEIL